MVSFAVQKLVRLIRSHLFIFAYISIALGDWPKKTLVRFMSENLLRAFSSRNFMVSCLIFQFLSHFEFIFVYDVRVCSNLIDLHAAVQLSQHHLLRSFSLFFKWISLSLSVYVCICIYIYMYTYMYINVCIHIYKTLQPAFLKQCIRNLLMKYDFSSYFPWSCNIL